MSEKIGVILLAGGSGSRMIERSRDSSTPPPKQLRLLGGKPLLTHSLSLFLQMPEVAEVVLVLSAEFTESIKPWCDDRVRIAKPGSSRCESMYNGLLAMDPSLSLVCVHDAARPFITKTQVEAVCAAARTSGAASLAMPVKSTITQATETGEVQHLLDRSLLWEMQTPQVAPRSWLLEGYKSAQAKGMTPTDEISLIAHAANARPGVLIKGSYDNIKITTPEDWRIAEQKMDAWRITRMGVYGVWIQNGKILLVEKGPHGVYAGKLDLPGGGIEFGESPEETLIREWREEVGMHVTRYHSLKAHSVLITVPQNKNYPFTHFHHIGLLYSVDQAEPLGHSQTEHSFGWYPTDGLSEERLTPFAYAAIKESDPSRCVNSI